MENNLTTQPDIPNVENFLEQAPAKKNWPGKKVVLITLTLIVIAATGVLIILALNLNLFSSPRLSEKLQSKPEQKSLFASQPIEWKKFTSQAEFKAYLKDQQSLAEVTVPAPDQTALMMPSAESGKSPERVSQTNVQVIGIDEPDIIKTDGQNIYLSSSLPYQTNDTLKIITALPPESLKTQAEIEDQGNLLLKDDTLLVLGDKNIRGYDIKNPAQPSQKWKIELGKNNRLTASRLYRDKVYIVSQTYITPDTPCPVHIMSYPDTDLIIPCKEIFHPATPAPTDTTFTALILNPDSGETEKKISFVGAADSSIVYMSPDALYISNTLSQNYNEILYGFYQEEGGNLLPSSVFGKLKALKDLDISVQAKFTETQVILTKYQNTLNEEEKLTFNNKMQGLLKNYSQKHLRDFTKTGLTKIKLENLEIKASGTVPGRPLNQFSLDEYKENLRIAVTAGEGSLGTSESVNDLYILDKDLKVIGLLTDLGLGERIYSARFIKDQGYLVTFKQTDPFYVLDLSDPKKPEKRGELKIPGYSSYLDPLAQNRILGIGKEGTQIKLSLFDVSNPADPKEMDKYFLDEYWSEILDNHHAFLKDEKHRVFFLPGGSGGYVFSFVEDKLSLKKAVRNLQTKRAIYINDYLYIYGENQLLVFDEKNWEELKQLIL